MWQYVKAAFIAGIVVAILVGCYLLSWLVIPLALGVAVFAVIVEDQRKKKDSDGTNK